MDLSDNFSSNNDILNSENPSILEKIFTFYYFTNKNSKINVQLTSIFLCLETVQLISYAFTKPLIEIWQFSEKAEKYVKPIISGFRLSMLFHFFNYDLFFKIWVVLLIFLFLFFLSFGLSLQINSYKSKFYRFNVLIAKHIYNDINNFFFIPILETLLLMLKCTDGKIVFDDGIECYKSYHLIYTVLSIIFALLFICFVVLNCFFNFTPFEIEKNTNKISNHNEMQSLIIKIIIVLCYIFKIKQWIFIIVLFFGSMINFSNGYNRKTYNNDILEIIISIKNCSVLWSYFVLILGRLSENDTYIYFGVFGYPLIIYFAYVYKLQLNKSFSFANSNNNSEEYLNKILFFIHIMNEEFKVNNLENKNNNQNESDLILNGLIYLHEENCVDEDCPLKNYLNANSDKTKKMCLLNYINIMFMNGLKFFPKNHLLMIHYVHFNISKKYNMNSAKIFLNQIENMELKLKEKYIVFTIKEGINFMNNENDETFKEKISFKFKRLKFLIEETTKIFSDFWGILSTNLTSNLNLTKIFFLGKKLNSYLKEIQEINEQDIKNKKIDVEFHSILQLYSVFLQKILFKKNESEEILKKIEDEAHFDQKKNESQKIDVDNLENILENPDIVAFCRSNEKGECSFIQCSNSFVEYLGYLKNEIIGQKIEILMPSMFTEDNIHQKNLMNNLKYSKGNKGLDQKKTILIVPKNKIDFILPCNVRLFLLSEDDFKNSYLIKVKFETREQKNSYPYFILTKNDFTVDSISSSCSYLGLTQDLIKKQIIDLDILIRNKNFEALNFVECESEYEEPNEVYWVYPYLIYNEDEKNENTYNNNNNNNNNEIENLILRSQRKKFNLTINKFKFGENGKIVAYLFKLIDIKDETKINERNFKNYKYIDKNIMFDIYNLRYIRYTDNENLYKFNHHYIQLEYNLNTNTPKKIKIEETTIGRKEKISGKSNRKMNKSNDNSSDNEEESENEKEELTSELISKMQAKNSNEILNLIYNLRFYGKKISLEKHRPNKEKYAVGYSSESLIKINLTLFKKRIDDKIKLLKQSKKLPNDNKTPEENNSEDPQKKSNITISNVKINNSVIKPVNIESNEEVINDANIFLNKYISNKSVKHITYLSYFMFLSYLILIIFEFILTFSFINKINKTAKFEQRSYDILNSIVYTKYFITECVLANTPNFKNLNNTSSQDYILDHMNELSNYRHNIINTYNFFTNETTDKLKIFLNSKQLYIRIFNNQEENNEILSLDLSMSRLVTNIFYVSTINENYNKINMNDRNTFELMQNLLNDYLIIWHEITDFICYQIYEYNNLPKRCVTIFIVSFILLIMNFFLIYKFLNKFIEDKEKPIELFFTVKKKIFEQLKLISENLVNKLLNKNVGNELAENDNKSNEFFFKIENNDIVIKKLNTHKTHHKNKPNNKEFLFYFLYMISIFIFINIFLTTKFLLISSSLKSLYKYSQVINTTEFSQINVVESCDFFKSYLFNSSIPILNSTDTEQIIFNRIQNISDVFEELILSIYVNLNYLNSNFEDFFFNNLNENITDLAQGGVENIKLLQYKMEHGCKGVYIRYCELFRLLWSYKLDGHQINLNFSFFHEINNILRNIIRPWYSNLKDKLYKDYNDYVDFLRLLQIIGIIGIGLILVLFYLFFWRNLERNLFDKLHTSLELLNLLPQELKNQIVNKLNEENDENNK